MQILKVQAYATVDNRYQITILAKADDGRIIQGNTHFVSPSEAPGEIDRVRAIMDSTQESVFSANDADLKSVERATS